MPKQLMTILLCVVALAAVVAGCGGSDEDAPTPTKKQFTKQASAVCLQGVRDIQLKLEKTIKQRAKEKTFGTDEALPAEIANQIVLPNFETQVEDLRALGAPKGDEAEVEKMWDTFETAIADSKQDPKGMFRGEVETLEDVRTMATKYGLEYCGQI